MKYIIASDLHGNLEAFKILKNYIDATKDLAGILLLGDLVDYCPHTNEVIEEIRGLDIPIVCNLWGNHEDLILGGDLSRLSSDRGRSSAAYTMSIIKAETKEYINTHMIKDGFMEFTIGRYKCLAVHGSLEDTYWGKLNANCDLDGYEKYDYVFSGHSHIPHFFEYFYPADNPLMRDKKKTVFINPGSLGQPRNHCPLCQFVIWDETTSEVDFVRLEYDILMEQSAFSDKVDEFYKNRLSLGV